MTRRLTIRLAVFWLLFDSGVSALELMQNDDAESDRRPVLSGITGSILVDPEIPADRLIVIAEYCRDPGNSISMCMDAVAVSPDGRFELRPGDAWIPEFTVVITTYTWSRPLLRVENVKRDVDGIVDARIQRVDLRGRLRRFDLSIMRAYGSSKDDAYAIQPHPESEVQEASGVNTLARRIDLAVEAVNGTASLIAPIERRSIDIEFESWGYATKRVTLSATSSVVQLERAIPVRLRVPVDEDSFTFLMDEDHSLWVAEPRRAVIGWILPRPHMDARRPFCGLNLRRSVLLRMTEQGATTDELWVDDVGDREFEIWIGSAGGRWHSWSSLRTHGVVPSKAGGSIALDVSAAEIRRLVLDDEE